MAAPWQSTIGKPQGTIGKMRGASIGRRQSTAIWKMRGATIGKPHGTIGKQEITYAVRRMRRPLMPM